MTALPAGRVATDFMVMVAMTTFGVGGDETFFVATVAMTTSMAGQVLIGAPVALAQMSS